MKGSRAGVFVSMKIRGKLRGCIGTISAVTDSVAEEIVRNAVSACSEDPRFDPVTAGELERIHYSVDVLGPTEKIDSASELDPSATALSSPPATARGCCCRISKAWTPLRNS